MISPNIETGTTIGTRGAQNAVSHKVLVTYPYLNGI